MSISQQDVLNAQYQAAQAALCVEEERLKMVQNLRRIHDEPPASDMKLHVVHLTFSREEFRALLDLWMCSDPWPVTVRQGALCNKRDETNHRVVTDILNREAATRGFTDVVEAYHNFKVQS